MIRAYRFWRLMCPRNRPNELQLWSIYMQMHWEGPHLRAEYPPQWHADDGHGIYAYKQPQTNHTTISPPPMGLNYVGLVAGWVQLWGRIIEHDEGYRAEHALIESLIQHSNSTAIFITLQHRYGVEVTSD